MSAKVVGFLPANKHYLSSGKDCRNGTVMTAVLLDLPCPFLINICSEYRV